MSRTTQLRQQNSTQSELTWGGMAGSGLRNTVPMLWVLSFQPRRC